jgi:hypothetical protein
VSQATIEFRYPSAESFFRSITESHLRSFIKGYDQIIEIEEDRFVPGVYPITHRLSGKPRPYPPKNGQGYLALMKQGLEIAIRVLNERFPQAGGNEGEK